MYNSKYSHGIIVYAISSLVLANISSASHSVIIIALKVIIICGDSLCARSQCLDMLLCPFVYHTSTCCGGATTVSTGVYIATLLV